MTSFVCKECGYRFESGLENRKRKCPYCGKEGISRELSATELLEEE
ncbi:hypothetical protein HYT23_03715 [Candidatus Pacearchaeota archaeon]|nr:hypothetical protein [Candidatus Pacearchaeota archaeon]